MKMLIVAWLAVAGCKLPCAAGIVANFEAEVGPRLNPCTVSRSGAGLAQWAGARRRRMLAALGADWCTGYARQLAFVDAELREIGLRDRLYAATDPGAAAALFVRGYEQPRNRDPRRRMARAREIYIQMMTDRSHSAH